MAYKQLKAAVHFDRGNEHARNDLAVAMLKVARDCLF